MALTGAASKGGTDFTDLLSPLSFWFHVITELIKTAAGQMAEGGIELCGSTSPTAEGAK
jgi:hypothetical protein